MTAKERAAFKRLERRNESMFVALCIIKMWLSFPEDITKLRFQIGQLCEERIQAERAAREKEGAQ